MEPVMVMKEEIPTLGHGYINLKEDEPIKHNETDVPRELKTHSTDLVFEVHAYSLGKGPVIEGVK